MGSFLKVPTRLPRKENTGHIKAVERYKASEKGRLANARAQMVFRLRRDGAPEAVIADIKADMESYMCPIFRRPIIELGGFAVDREPHTGQFRSVISARAAQLLRLVDNDPQIAQNFANHLKQKG